MKHDFLKYAFGKDAVGLPADEQLFFDDTYDFIHGVLMIQDEDGVLDFIHGDKASEMFDDILAHFCHLPPKEEERLACIMEDTLESIRTLFEEIMDDTIDLEATLAKDDDGAILKTFATQINGAMAEACCVFTNTIEAVTEKRICASQLKLEI